MKALVLAGGSGTRLRPITHTRAKQLLPLANKPILFYCLESLERAGIKDVGIIVGDTAAEVRDAVGDGSRLGIRATFIEQDSPRGLAHAVLIAKDFLGDDQFIMYLGDNLIVGGIDELVEDFSSHEGLDASVLLKQVENPTQFGVGVLKADGTIDYLVEKPADPPSNLALVGCYGFGPSIHEAVRKIAPSARGELEITDAIQWLIDKGYTVGASILEKPWLDTGKWQDMIEANRIVLDEIETEILGEIDEFSRVSGRVIIGKDAKILSSVVRGPAIIGDGAVIRDSYIGPYTSIDDSCIIENTEVEHSVILRGSSLKGIERLQDSLIGRNTSVERDRQVPKALRLMVGDDSSIKVPN